MLAHSLSPGPQTMIGKSPSTHPFFAPPRSRSRYLRPQSRTPLASFPPPLELEHIPPTKTCTNPPILLFRCAPTQPNHLPAPFPPLQTLSSPPPPPLQQRPHVAFMKRQSFSVSDLDVTPPPLMYTYPPPTRSSMMTQITISGTREACPFCVPLPRSHKSPLVCSVVHLKTTMRTTTSASRSAFLPQQSPQARRALPLQLCDRLCRVNELLNLCAHKDEREFTHMRYLTDGLP
ncbi:hypothetical protein EDB89DRAFT_292486 [Lactarius sanguifluus]|nr:hypothetical protein EDB89DRAFT_292486 [Lactarius sanguifluus]